VDQPLIEKIWPSKKKKNRIIEKKIEKKKSQEKR